MSSVTQRRSNKERTETTRNALLAAARELFVEKGYAETGTPEIVKKAAVTRGALYHHYEDKRDLFRGVVSREASEIAEEIRDATREVTSTREALTNGSEAYFRAMKAPGRVRLMLLDGPSVLGREEMDFIDENTGVETLREGLRFGLEHGELVPMPIEAMASLLSAMFDRAALAIAAGEPDEPYRRAVALLIDGFLVKA